jgi:hypothetical protein
MTLEQIVGNQMDDRVRGFWHGYHFTSGSAADLKNPQFCKGWNEGMELLLDERRAATEYLKR